MSRHSFEIVDARAAIQLLNAKLLITLPVRIEFLAEVVMVVFMTVAIACNQVEAREGDEKVSQQVVQTGTACPVEMTNVVHLYFEATLTTRDHIARSQVGRQPQPDSCIGIKQQPNGGRRTDDEVVLEGNEYGE